MPTPSAAKLSDGELAFASLAGGSLSALATIPMDVYVATVQQASKAGAKVSVLETFKDQIKQGNVVKFATRGLAARVTHVALTTFMMKTMTTKIYDMLYAPKAATGGSGAAPMK